MNIDNIRKTLNAAMGKRVAATRAVSEFKGLQTKVAKLHDDLRNADSDEAADAISKELIGASETLRLRELTSERRNKALDAAVAEEAREARSALRAIESHYQARANEAAGIVDGILRTLIVPEVAALHCPATLMGISRERSIEQLTWFSIAAYTAGVIRNQANSANTRSEDGDAKVPAKEMLSSWEADNARIDTEIAELKRLSTAVRGNSDGGGVMPPAVATPEREPALAGLSAG